MVKKIFYLLALSLFLSSPLAAEEELPLHISGDYLEYLEKEGVILGRGNVEVKYGAMRMRADWAKLYLEKELLLAEGNVTLFEAGEEFHGEKLTYDLKAGKGTLDEAWGFLAPWFWRAERMEKVAEGEYHLKRAEFTTCYRPRPCHRFVARRMRIYLGKRLWAYHIVFYAGGVPVAYLPIYRRSLREVPYGFILWPVGYSQEKGWFALSRYNWYVNPELRGRLFLDYFQRLGVGKGFDVSYRFGSGERTGKGHLYGYFIREREFVWGRPGERRTDRHKLHLRHRQELAPDTVGLLRIDRFSDAYFNIDFEDGERARGFARKELTGQAPEGSLSITRRHLHHATRIYMRKRVNDFLEVVERLPEVTFDLNRRELGDSSFYKDFHSSLIYFRESPEGGEAVQAGSHVELSRPSRWGWLRLEPALGLRGFWYSQDRLGNRNLWMGNYEMRLGMNATFFSPLFRWREMHLRHLIQPRLTYHYSPEPPEDIDDLFHFTDRLPLERDYFDLQLINRLKSRMAGGKGRDLAVLTLRSRFHRDREDYPWGDLIADLELWPTEKISFEGEANLDINTGWLNKFSTNFRWREERWQISLGTEYHHPRGENRSFDTIVNLDWQVSPEWKLGLYSRYDWTGNEDLGIDPHHEEWRVAIIRDLCCWEGQIFVEREWRPDRRDELSIAIAFRLKGIFPDPLKIPVR
ncbi:LPS assembly protein LptD [candidate division NPL-UPA2 bacterium]|nr:LPS assembly protein LptD [candidate division NPL-UPA2 bacterium]